MSRLTVLQSLQTILETEFDRVYVYPDEFDDVENDPQMPFFALEELPASENNTIAVGGFADLLGIEWTVSLYGYVAICESEAPGDEDAAGKTLAYVARDTIRTLLQANMTPGGALAQFGDERRFYTDAIVRIQWGKQIYIGLYFEIPVTSG